MGNLITVRRLWDNGELAVGSCTISIACDQMTGSTPRNAWLTPVPGCPSPSGYALSLAYPGIPYPNGPLPAGTLLGVWIELLDGSGLVVDAISVQAVIDACNGCCGGTGVVAPRYGGIIPVPPPLIARTYTISRIDQGSDYSYDRMQLDYWPGYISGTFNKISHNPTTGVTVYSFEAYTPPILMGADILVSTSPAVIVSNTVPTPGGGQVLVLAFTNQNGLVVPKITAASAVLLVGAASTNALYNAWGTWTNTPPTITLTSTNVTAGSILVTAVTPVVFTSNDPGAPTGGDVVELTGTFDGVTPAPISAATAALLATALSGSPVYNIYGTWAAVGTHITLTSAVVTNAQLVLALVAP